MLLWDTRLQSQGSTGAARRGEDLERCWQALAAADAVAAHAAMASLSRQPTASLALLRQRLQPIAALSAERIEALIARLDADPFEAREEAYQALRTLGKAAEPRLRQALAKKPGLDLRLALERLVEELGPVVGVPGETLRGVRAVRRAGSARDARSQGTPGATGPGSGGGNPHRGRESRAPALDRSSPKNPGTGRKATRAKTCSPQAAVVLGHAGQGKRRRGLQGNVGADCSARAGRKPDQGTLESGGRGRSAGVARAGGRAPAGRARWRFWSASRPQRRGSSSRR